MTTSFDRQQYGPVIAELLADEQPAPLGPGRERADVRSQLVALPAETPLATAGNRAMADACVSGLWLYHNFLDRSHEISQSLHNQEGSYWHAVMHRREPDYSNSKYWFRQVGTHPVFEPLAAAASALANTADVSQGAEFLTAQTNWDPMRFVDLCQQAAGSGSALEQLCRDVQHREWQLLFDYCWQRALA